MKFIDNTSHISSGSHDMSERKRQKQFFKMSTEFDNNTTSGPKQIHSDNINYFAYQDCRMKE